MKTRQTTIPRAGAKWLPSAMALAATTASSHAAVVQITLSGNMISSLGGNQFNADLTGDGSADLTQLAGLAIPNQAMFLGYDLFGGAPFAANATALFSRYYNATVGPVANAGGGPQSATAALQFTFSDARINGGSATSAWLEVRAFNTGMTNNTVEFTRLIFNEADPNSFAESSFSGVQTEWSAIPEPSSFALLGLGAAGLLARRRRQAA
jgi:hypothetical protein